MFRALVIRLRLEVPQAGISLRRLAVYRSELGPDIFGGLLAQATLSAETMMSLLGRLDR